MRTTIISITTNRFLLLLTLASASLIAAVGCSPASEEEETESSEAELVTLTKAQCKTPTIHTAPFQDSSGQPIYGTAHTTIDGCIFGAAASPSAPATDGGNPADGGHADGGVSSGTFAVTGASMITRTVALLGNTASFATLKDSEGNLVFSQFSPRPASGSTQDVDVTLNVDNSPYGRLRVVRERRSDGRYHLNITNVQPFKANALGFFPVTVIQPNNLKVDVMIRPEANGVTVTGSGDITLDVAQEKAEASSQLVRDVFEWLRGKLTSP